jgi:hypothetical protein
MSDTPRTDAIVKGEWLQYEKHARQLERELNEIKETYANIINEPCRSDERHCTCVPSLRGEIERLKSENEKKAFCEWTTQAKGYRLVTACGHSFDQDHAMTASMHGFTFCPYCGKVIKEVTE